MCIKLAASLTKEEKCQSCGAIRIRWRTKLYLSNIYEPKNSLKNKALSKIPTTQKIGAFKTEKIESARARFTQIRHIS